MGFHGISIFFWNHGFPHRDEEFSTNGIDRRENDIKLFLGDVFDRELQVVNNPVK